MSQGWEGPTGMPWGQGCQRDALGSLRGPGVHLQVSWTITVTTGCLGPPWSQLGDVGPLMSLATEVTNVVEPHGDPGGSLTFSHIDSEGAPGDLGASVGDSDGVWPFEDGPVGAAEHVVPLVLQHHLHRVPPALGVRDHHPHIARASPCHHRTWVSAMARPP